MQGTIDGFSYGLVTPVAAFLMACLGAALGLRCTVRSLRAHSSWKPGGLALGAAAIGSGIWTMHFIAMTGFSVAEAPIGYDAPTTFASLAVGIIMVGIGIFIVGYRGSTRMALVTGGIITGLAIATMHYLGMAGMRVNGRVDYDIATVTLSVLIAVAAATAALWVVVSHRGFLAGLAASLVMGVASTGMHYTGMSAVHVHLAEVNAAPGGEPATELLIPMLIGPAVFLLLAGVAVLFDPFLVAGRDREERPAPAVPGPCDHTGVPAQRSRARSPHREPADRAAARSARPRHGSQDLHDW
ncbi:MULTISPECIES: MHYT domain-containing protein [unclassified Streptomyces]|uniref:MHYT domain-containing protein n=1 Tax=unclassified Streptomyces TaxID=2593676 RepID=UPI002E297908|nr:MHYT domain-containing protein [Streptomyces sp. NBC_01429]